MVGESRRRAAALGPGSSWSRRYPPGRKAGGQAETRQVQLPTEEGGREGEPFGGWSLFALLPPVPTPVPTDAPTLPPLAPWGALARGGPREKGAGRGGRQGRRAGGGGGGGRRRWSRRRKCRGRRRPAGKGLLEAAASLRSGARVQPGKEGRVGSGMMASRSSSPSSCSSSEEEEAGAWGPGPRSPVGLEGCGCCLALAHRQGLEAEAERRRLWGQEQQQQQPPRRRWVQGQQGSPPGTPPASPAPSGGSPFPLRLRDQRFCRRNLNAARLRRMLSGGGWLEPVLRDPCYLRDHGLCNRNVDQTLLSILLFFHSASGSSVVAIDNKIEQAMDLVKNHLMYAVREEVEVLKEQIKELAEKNSQLERENCLLKTLASPEQLQKFQSCLPLEGQPPAPNPLLLPPSGAPSSPLALAAAEKQSPAGPAASLAAQHSAGSAV
ncbi:TSC22 domain family protein 3 isoform X1 [Sceloporus undulatus]|uniref:TSC22 domain family protein 3 isoform X1 n=1 Tax=Sceloporus undulatus TaxID=8520 RepID=UPI001C4CD2A2|nr:TSC22 domain family protein 3 isoform X1 [Sceloporus undulatus]